MAGRAQRLDCTGRRIVVLAGPGDRRNEDLVAIADAVAGRFDHYICRRDDALRGREPDEVPRIISGTLRAKGVPDAAISIIPDEQAAIDAALRMGQPGDLLLVFADALVRSWKQITKFKPSDASPAGAGAGSQRAGAGSKIAESSPQPPPAVVGPGTGMEEGVGRVEPLNLEGLIRDERGVRFAPETDD
jgi:cyanophycin synthetase